MKLRLAVLLSGGGRTLENLVSLSRANELAGEVVLAISSSPRAGGVERASRLGVPCLVETDPERIFSACEAERIDLVCLAGWIKLLPIPERWRWRLLNIHPALLPSFGGKGFYGDRVHEAVLAAGVKVSGCTVHFCDDQYDHGPIVLQRVCPVLEDDDVHALAARVFEEEKVAYPEAIRLFQEGRLEVDGRRVRIKPSRSQGT